MKKLVIAGSSKLHERALYWRGYFEGRGYDVIDWPSPVSDGDEENLDDEPQVEPGLSLGHWLSPNDSDYAARLTKIYKRFYKNLDQTDAFFLMNEDKDGIEGYIGASAIAELTYVVTGNLNRGKKVDINILKLPSKNQNCYDEVKFWLDQKWIKIYRRPTGRKASIPVPGAPTLDTEPIAEATPEVAPEPTPEPSAPQNETVAAPTPAAIPAPRRSGFFGSRDKSIDILTCKKSCLKSLTPEVRAYLNILSPDFPSWLLKYLAAPEMQRLSTVSMVNVDYNALYNLAGFNSVFQHSIGVALIIWNFTHDKIQTLAGLFHDIASPAFKHAIDYMNGDSEHQESIEEHTADIIRNSRVITRQLKKDGILPSEVSDYKLYPIADNESPRLAADRLEYNFSNGLFLFNTWSLDKVKTYYDNIVVLKNEDSLDELGFKDADLCADYVLTSLPQFEIYNSDKSRVILQFTADILQSMINSGYLNNDDLYVMTEREINDWILSCGDRSLSDAFRQYQRATTFYAGATAKKNCYCVSVKGKIRYIVPLVASNDDEESASRITDLNRKVNSAVKSHANAKGAKYVGFDFDFKPYTA